jgi:hypothetical protein
MVLTEQEKKKMTNKFNIEKFHLEKSFYVYESDFKSLDKWNMLTSMSNVGSSGFCFHEIVKSKLDDLLA